MLVLACLSAGGIGTYPFARLAEGQHPFTGESLVRHRTPCRYANERGQSVTTMAHRAGWDATFGFARPQGSFISQRFLIGLAATGRTGG
jgi:hypothetical protein